MAFLKKSNDGPREDPIIVKPKVYPKKTLRSFRTPNDFCITKKLFILFSVLVYDTVGDGVNIHLKHLDFEGLIFKSPATSRSKLKNFLCYL